MKLSRIYKRTRTVMVVALSSLVLFATSSLAQMPVDKETLAGLHSMLKRSSSPTLVYRSPVDCPLQVEALKVKKKKAKFQVYGSGMELVCLDADGVEEDVVLLRNRDVLKLKLKSRLSIELDDDEIEATASSFSIRCTPVEEEPEPLPGPILY